MITYSCQSRRPVSQVARWLAARRKAHDQRPWQRAATPFVQAVMVLRWFKNATDLPTLASDARVSIATAHRFHLHEAIDVIAGHAPDLLSTTGSLTTSRHRCGYKHCLRQLVAMSRSGTGAHETQQQWAPARRVRPAFSSDAHARREGSAAHTRLPQHSDVTVEVSRRKGMR